MHFLLGREWVIVARCFGAMQVHARLEGDIPNWMKGYCNGTNIINVNQLQVMRN